MTRTLLVRPPELHGVSFAQFYTLHESLGIGYLAAYLRAHGHAVEILDAHVEGLSVKETIARIEKRGSDLLGFSIVSSLVMPQTVQIIREIKAKQTNLHVTMGGQHPTFFYESILKKSPGVDSVVRFEGEETLLALIEKIDQPDDWKSIQGIAFRENGSIRATPPRPLIKDLDSLPFPARDTLPLLMGKGGLPLLSTSRGCTSRCSFCSVHCFYNTPKGRNWRARSSENVLQEIEILNREFGCDELWFVDDNFLGPGKLGRRRVRSFFPLLEKSGIKLKRIDFSCRADSVVQEPDLIDLAAKHGAGLVYLGVEAGVQRILDLYNKGTTVEQNTKAVRVIKDSGAEIKMEFILFNPWITFEEVKETISFLETVGVYDPYILTSVLTIMKHTPMAREIEAGRLKVVSPPPDELARFDLDAFVPYQISDERCRALFQIVSMVISQVEPALCATYDVYNLLQKRRKTLRAETVSQYKEAIDDYQQLINETSLDLFKDAVAAVEKMDLPVDAELLRSYGEDLTQKTLRFAAFLTNIVKTQEKELQEYLDESAEHITV